MQMHGVLAEFRGDNAEPGYRSESSAMLCISDEMYACNRGIAGSKGKTSRQTWHCNSGESSASMSAFGSVILVDLVEMTGHSRQI